MAAEHDEDPGWTVRRLATHGTEVIAVSGAALRGEPVAVTAGNDGQVCFWDLTDGTLRLAISAKPPGQSQLPQPRALAVQSDTLYSGWSDGIVRALDLKTGLEHGTGERMRRKGVDAGITDVAVFGLGPDDGRLVAAWTDGRVAIASSFDTEPIPGKLDLTGRQIRSRGQPVWSFAVADESGRHLVYADVGGGEILCWAVPRGGVAESLGPIRIDRTGRSPALLHITEHRLLLAADDASLVLIDPLDDAALERFDVGVDEITALDVLVDLDIVDLAVVGGADGVVSFVTAPGRMGRSAVRVAAVGEGVEAFGRYGDSVIVGGAHGGVYVVEPAVPAGPVVSDRVELQDDVPGETVADDRLRRSPLAEALAVRLERRHEEGREKSFLVHLDGPWGSGKTTVLNFVAGQLGDGWTIVRYNAWRQARVGPPWWTLLTALRTEVLRRRRLAGKASLWFREMLQQRIARASGLPATLLILLAALGVFLLWDVEVGDTLTTVQGVAAALTAVATLFAGAQFVAGFFGWHSARGAKAFQDLDANPMDRVAAHFSWLVEQERRPIAYFVDDLDRCPAHDVVELLEAVQTLVRDAGDGGGHRSDNVLSPCFVVAGDGAWIRQAFEEYYSEFADEIAEPGRPLGYLFLAKIFQLTMPVPRIGPVRQAEFFRELLGLRDPDVDPAATAAVVDEARKQVATAPNDDAQQQVLADLPQAVREVVAPAAVRRQTEPAFAAATEHRLSGFAELLPDNPRAVKRFLNAFALTRSVRTVEGQAIPTACLALWTILQTRWPLLADALTAHPEWVDPESAEKAQVPADVRALLDDAAVRHVLDFTDGGPLTPDLVRACRGG